MTRPKIVGYIVHNQYGVYSLHRPSRRKDAPTDGVLKIGGPATLFDTRTSVNRAIRRTRQFAGNHNYNWGPWEISSVASVGVRE